MMESKRSALIFFITDTRTEQVPAVSGAEYARKYSNPAPLIFFSWQSRRKASDYHCHIAIVITIVIAFPKVIGIAITITNAIVFANAISIIIANTIAITNYKFRLL